MGVLAIIDSRQSVCSILCFKSLITCNIHVCLLSIHYVFILINYCHYSPSLGHLILCQ